DFHVTGVQTCALPIFDWEGQPAVLVSLSDVTAQVQMRRTELMLREAVDNLSDSFILYDAEQRVVLTNRRFHESFPFLPPQDEIEIGRASCREGGEQTM